MDAVLASFLDLIRILAMLTALSSPQPVQLDLPHEPIPVLEADLDVAPDIVIDVARGPLTLMPLPTPVPCDHEDTNNEPGNLQLSADGVAVPCVWDAAERGNGLGRSFIAYPDGSLEFIK